MFGSIFNPENHLWQTVDHLADLLILSLMWLLFSLPVLTAGAASAALYDAVAHCVRGSEPLPWRRFWQTFRRELPGAAAVTLAWGALLVLLANALALMAAAAAAGTSWAVTVLLFCLVLMVLPVGAACWMFPLLSRFTFTPLGAVKVSFQFSLAYLPRTFLLVLTLLAAGLVSALYWAPALVLPCLVALLWSLVMEPLFSRHAPADPPREGED